MLSNNFNPTTTLPSALTAIPNWLLWKLTPQASSKPRKVPYYINGRKRQGKQCTPGDRAQFATYKEAVAAFAAGGYSGIGFALTPDSGVVALDFDNVVKDGGIDSRVVELCEGTYTEYSPSGTGIRAFMAGSLQSKKDTTPPPGEFSVEVFGNSGFVTVTGDVTPDCLIWGHEEIVCTLTPAVKALYACRFGPGKDAAPDAPGESQDVVDSIAGVAPTLGMTDGEIAGLLARLPPVLGYDKWLKVGMALHHETSGDGFDTWDAWSTSIPGYGSRAQNESHWSSFGRPTTSPVTMASILHMVKEYEALGLAAAMESIPPNASRYKLLDSADLRALPPLEWLVKGVLPSKSLAAIFGASGSGKSFLALDLACHIAGGVMWFEHRVKAAPVVYVALEGETGLQGRIRAWEEHHGTAIPEGMHLILQSMCLTTAQDLKDLASVVPRGSVVFLDTLNRAAPGADENSSSDMGHIVSGAKALQAATGGTVVLIHHSGKDAAKGMRGHSSLFAALDASIEVSREGDSRKWQVAKSKEGKDGLGVGFALDVKQLGTDGDGDAITSCIVVPTGYTPPAVRKPLAHVQRQVLEALGNLNVETVHIDAWRKAFYAMRLDHTRGTNDTAFGRAVPTLLTSGYVSKNGDSYSVIDAF